MSASRWRNKRPWHWSLEVGKIAWQLAFSALIGFISLLFIPHADTLEARMLDLQPINYQTLNSAALSDSDEHFVVIAKVAPANFVDQHGFVAYQSQRSEIDIRDQQIWVTDASKFPQLVLEMEGGSFNVLPDYSLGGTLHTNDTHTRRMQGLQIGDELLVYGSLVSNRDTIIVEANYLYAGDYAELRTSFIQTPQLIRYGSGLIVGLVSLCILWGAGYRPSGKRVSSANTPKKKGS